MTRTELIAALKAAEGPSRELDAEIMAVLHFKDERHIGEQEEDALHDCVWHPVKSSVWVSKATGEWVSTQPHSYTSSIDAAVALVEQCLPEWEWSVCGGWKSKAGEACLWKTDADHTGWHVASTVSFAILIALLTALEAKENGDE